MDVLRVIHFADLHLGVEAGGRPNPATGLNQRVHDVLDRLDELCECAEREDVHLVVFAGDAFKHQHPTPTLQSLFAQRMRRLARAGSTVFLLVGNHDLPKMASLSHPFSIYDALEVDGVVVGDRAAVYRLALRKPAPAPHVQIGALPHFSRQQALLQLPEGTDLDAAEARIQDAIDRTVRGLGAQTDPSLPALFCGHCHVNQAEISGSQSFFGVSDLEVTMSSLASSDAFPYYALGHVHQRQVLRTEPWVAYAGSLERVDFSEGDTFRVSRDGKVRHAPAEQKGFYRFDLARVGQQWTLATEPEFRAVSARRFVTIRSDAVASPDPTETVLGSLQRVRDAGGLLDDAFVKVNVSIDAHDRGRLSARAIKDAAGDAYDLRVVVDAVEETVHVRDPQFATRMAEAEALERYVRTRSDWADERDELLRRGRELIQEVLG